MQALPGTIVLARDEGDEQRTAACRQRHHRPFYDVDSVNRRQNCNRADGAH